MSNGVLKSGAMNGSLSDGSKCGDATHAPAMSRQ
jgi:hypothetical protein